MAAEVNLPVSPTPKTSWTIPLLLILSIFSLAISGYLFWQNQQLQKQLAGKPTATASPQTAAESPDPTAGWKVFNGQITTFKYPADWTVGEEFSNYFNGNILTIENPSKKVSIEVTPQRQPYGFGPKTGFKETQINLVIADNNFITKETVINNRTAYVDLPIEVNSKQYFILFGTGYPVNDDQKASLREYTDAKTAIYQILSTFKFTR